MTHKKKLYGNNGGSSADAGLSFRLPLKYSLRPSFARGSSTATFTRATSAVANMFTTRQASANSGEIRFVGARREENKLLFTETLDNGAWGSVIAGTGTAASVTSGQTDPLGGSTAWRVQASIGVGTTSGDLSTWRQTLGTALVSPMRTIWAKSNTGASQIVALDVAATTQTITVTTSWQRFGYIATGSLTRFDIGTRGDGGTSKSIDILVWHPSMSEMQGRADQRPPEYIPNDTGLYAAPFTGANVSGVQYFSTMNGCAWDPSTFVTVDATGSPINTSNSKLASLDGSSAGFVSTPDAAANRLSVLDITAKINMQDWSPATATNVISKDGNAGNRGWSLQVFTSGALRFTWSTDGTAVLTNTASANLSALPNNTDLWVHGTLDPTPAGDATNAKGNYWYSYDGTNWTRLGTADVTTAGSAALFATTANVAVGARYGVGTGSGLLNGNAYRAWATTAIGGSTKALDFNANDFSSGSTFVSSTAGETWTLASGARILGGSGSSSLPAPWDANGPDGSQEEAARTNNALWNRDFTNAAWVKTTMTATLDQVGMDGVANSASSLLATGANATVLQALVAASTTRTFGVYAKRITGTGAISVTADGTNYTTTAINTTGWTLIADTHAALNPNFGIKIATNTDKIAVDYAMYEDASFNSSPIPATTVAVARNADVLSYSVTGNLPATNFTLYGETQFPVIPNAASYWLFGTYVDANNATGVLWDGTNLIARRRIGGSNNDATIALTPTAGTTFKWAATFSSAATQIYLNGTAGTQSAVGTAPQLGSSFQIGADGNSANQCYGTNRNIRVYFQVLSASQIAAIA